MEVPSVDDGGKNEVEHFSSVKAYPKIKVAKEDLNCDSWSSSSLENVSKGDRAAIFYLINALFGLSTSRIDDEKELKPCAPENENMFSLMQQVEALKNQLKELKGWAEKKVLQAAKELSYALIELRTLKMDNHLKYGETEEDTRKELKEKQNALKMVRCLAESKNAEAFQLEQENAEIRTNINVVKLRITETKKIQESIEKKERINLKKTAALEKQCENLRFEIEEKRNGYLQSTQQLIELQGACKETEEILSEVRKVKKDAQFQVRKEMRLKKNAEVNLRRKNEALLQKIKIDCRLLKDYVERLRDEYTHLKACMDSYIRDTNFNKEEASSHGRKAYCDRTCLICKESEACVVFQPCSHQVICANCNKKHMVIVGSKCPRCLALVSKRICVHATSSQV